MAKNKAQPKSEAKKSTNPKAQPKAKVHKVKAKASKPVNEKDNVEPEITNPFAQGKYKKKPSSEFASKALVKNGPLVNLANLKKYPSVEVILAGNTYTKQVAPNKFTKAIGKLMTYDPTIKKMFTYVSLHTKKHDLYIFIDGNHTSCLTKEKNSGLLGFATYKSNSINICKTGKTGYGTIAHEFTHLALYNLFNRKCSKCSAASPDGSNPYNNAWDKLAFQKAKIEVMKGLLKSKSLYDNESKELANAGKTYELGRAFVESMDKLYTGSYDQDKCLNIVITSYYSLYKFYEKDTEDSEFIARLPEIKAQQCYVDKAKDILEPLAMYWDLVLKPAFNKEIACLESI